MPTDIIQWFPGHMAKTKRLIKECLSSVDIVLELVDARIPKSSKNPDIDTLTGQKPKLIIMTKASLADPAATKKWTEYYKSQGQRVVVIDSAQGQGFDSLSASIRDMLSEKLRRYNDKGMSGRHVKAMIVGIPNVGKACRR